MVQALPLIVIPLRLSRLGTGLLGQLPVKRGFLALLLRLAIPLLLCVPLMVHRAPGCILQ